MIPEIGRFCLYLALGLSIVQMAAGFVGPLRANPRIMALSQSAAFGQFLFVALAFAILVRRSESVV